AGALLAVGMGSWALVKTVPGVARLVYGDPPPPTAGPAPATVTGQPEWIAFETQRGRFGDYEIFVMAPAPPEGGTGGSRLTNLTNSWADDVAPAWSPAPPEGGTGGLHIAFVSARDTLSGKLDLEPGEIYVLEFDPLTGRAVGEARRLTESPAADGWPAWSPSGDQIAFHSDRGGDFDIWVMNADGSNPVNLTNHPGDDRYPAWSPAPPEGGTGGARIAFASDRDGSYDIWVMNADGSGPFKLTDSPARDRYPIWSPDGTHLTFNTDRDGNQEIYIMNASGGDLVNVTNTPYIEGLADWSPGGTRLVLYSEQKKDKDVYILDLATGQWTNITNSPYSDEYCTWWP
ncbi:MAG: PD40 domain-containing protein, partial [Anaerolineae bacterium]|nr:PD40 domain-containing protein [Anaerolineae bacterium]